MIESMRSAYRLWRSDEPVETVMAVVLVVAVFAPMLIQVYRRSNRRST
jgi:hypothetical protein